MIIYGTFELWGQLMLCGILSDSTFAFGSLVAKVSRGPEEDIEDAFAPIDVCIQACPHTSFSSSHTTNTSPQANTYPFSFSTFPGLFWLFPGYPKPKKCKRIPRSVQWTLIYWLPFPGSLRFRSHRRSPNPINALQPRLPPHSSSVPLLPVTPTRESGYTKVNQFLAADHDETTRSRAFPLETSAKAEADDWRSRLTRTTTTDVMSQRSPPFCMHQARKYMRRDGSGLSPCLP